MFCLTLVWNWFHAWIMCCLGVFICYLLGFWFINLSLSLRVCVFVCVCMLYLELGGACRQTSSSFRHPGSSRALPPWHLPQCFEAGNCQVTQNACRFMWVKDEKKKKMCAEVTNIFVLILGPWVVLWIIWCSSHHGGVPLCRPSCKSR